MSQNGLAPALMPLAPVAAAPPGPDGADPPPGRKAVLLRVDPAVHDALRKWASDNNRSVNAQVELILREALRRAGRLPSGTREPRRPGRPPTTG